MTKSQQQVHAYFLASCLESHGSGVSHESVLDTSDHACNAWVAEFASDSGMGHISPEDYRTLSLLTHDSVQDLSIWEVIFAFHLHVYLQGKVSQILRTRIGLRL
jgi:hypothetical protein